MAHVDVLTATVAPTPGERPRDRDLDLFGLTHPGKVRKENQDHFLLATVHHQIAIHGTSLPQPDSLPLRGERLATFYLVADGVGGSTGGGDASKLAAETVTRYVASTMNCYHTAGSSDEGEFLAALRAAALEAHAAVRGAAEARVADGGARAMATTLTLLMVVWPWAYVLQVGDSRCYYYWNGDLRQVTRDQTVAQDLVDGGVLKPEKAAASPFSHVLASSVGGDEASPVVTRLDIRQRGCVLLLCSDGLTKHVSDADLAQQLRSMQSSEQLCRALLDLALERGGTDNITVVAGRARGGRPSS
jgi:serine/threonine protein phosphatase PrpC